ncbi:MAG: CCA tRNA nucleotidyltransferase [Candidatus Omnitrophica bacterium]|nr:CCA tRNA nucleotidyltransferase [Candidatus Omnitrophota bacterium]MBI5024424.1 CCA tRNA nucleotidyltransferase [Candidatus Omnitrophota bacterium]
MKNYLSRVDKRILNVIRNIGRAADRQGLRAYIVGGIVRDIILGRKNLDIDIVTEGPAIPFAQSVAKATGAKVMVYPQFGTATLQWPFGLRLDLVAARQETYPHPGALPQVRPGTLKDDLFRRDFTINAMAICLNHDRWGQLVDEFGGLSDLREKKIRVLHERSFSDDPTRILRCVRFEQRLRFHIEPWTLGLLKQALREEVIPAINGGDKRGVDNVKPPRYFTEFKKMLAEEQPQRHLTRLKALGALRIVDDALKTDFHLLKQIQQRLSQAPEDIACNRWLISLMAITGTMSGAKLRSFLRKFPFRKEESESILQAARSEHVLRKLSAPKLSRSQAYGILKPLHQDTVVYLRFRVSQKKVVQRVDQYLRHDAGTRIDIDGEDLKRLGVSPGKKIGTILQKVLFMKIDGRVKNREQQLAAAAALAAK